MRRILIITLVVLVSLVALTTGIGAWLIQDGRFLTDQLSQWVARSTGREFRIEHPLRIDFGRETALEAGAISLQNAAWADGPEMLRIERLQLAIELSSLFSGPPHLTSLKVEGCTVEVLQNAAGLSNWAFPSADTDVGEQPDADPPLLIDRLAMDDCTLMVDGPDRPQALELAVRDARLVHDNSGRLEGRVRGALNGEDLALEGWIEPLAAFRLGGPLQLELGFTAGANRLSATGAVADAASISGPDLRIHFTGPDIARVLEQHALPPLSDGAFDFRAGLRTADGMTHIDIDGDLGSLDIEAEGQVDRLRQPTRGALTSTVSGPDLNAFGEALGIENLVSEAFDWHARFTFEKGRIHIEQAELSTAADRLSLAGELATREPFSGTLLDIALDSTEIGRWMPLTGRPEQALGALRLQARATIDDNGVAAIDGVAHGLSGTLKARGAVGALGGPLAPDLVVDLALDDTTRLAALLGRSDLPAAPATLSGRISGHEATWALDDVVLEVGGNRLRLNGSLRLADGPAGADLEIDLDTPDLAALGQLFGQPDLPAGPLQARGRVEKTADGLRMDGFTVIQAGNRAVIDGRLKLPDRFEGSDLAVDLDIADLPALGRLFGDPDLPDEPLQASGTVRRTGNSLDFSVSQGEMGETRLRLDGRIADLDRPAGVDARFDLQLPDTGILGFWWPDVAFPDGPLAARGRLNQRDDRVHLENVQLEFPEMTINLGGDFSPEGAVDLSLEIRGSDFSRLDALTGLQLPAVPFDLATGLRGDPGFLNFHGIHYRVGASEITGEATIARGDITRIEADMHAPLVDLNDWIERPRAQDGAAPGTPPRRRVFDDTPIIVLKDLGMELEADLQVDTLRLAFSRYQNIAAHVSLDGQRLRVDPFTVHDDIGGQLEGSLVLDSREGLPRLAVDALATDRRLLLGAAEGQDPATLPVGDLRLQLTGRGRTYHEMASALNGSVRLQIGPGRLAPSSVGFLLSDFGTQLLGRLNPFSQTDPYTQLECVVAAADVVAGEVSLEPAIFHGRRVTVVGQGTIDLDTEKLAITFNSKPRKGLGISASDLVNPFIRVGGTLAAPAMELDPAGTVVKGGIAVATAGLSILASSLADRYLSSKDPCGDALEKIAKRDAEKEH